MILKRVTEEYGFNIETLLIKESKRLKLTTKELNVLLVLFSVSPKRRIFSINSIVRKLDYSTNELAEIVESLMNKEFVKINLEIYNNKEREVYDLDGTYLKIENLFNEDEKEKVRNLIVSNVSEAISLLEDKFQRLLRPNELERIRTWYEDFNYKHTNIVSVISSLQRELPILTIEKMLEMNGNTISEIDEKTDKLLDSIFSKL